MQAIAIEKNESIYVRWIVLARSISRWHILHPSGLQLTKADESAASQLGKRCKAVRS